MGRGGSRGRDQRDEAGSAVRAAPYRVPRRYQRRMRWVAPPIRTCRRWYEDRQGASPAGRGRSAAHQLRQRRVYPYTNRAIIYHTATPAWNASGSGSSTWSRRATLMTASAKAAHGIKSQGVSAACAAPFAKRPKQSTDRRRRDRGSVRRPPRPSLHGCRRDAQVRGRPRGRIGGVSLRWTDLDGAQVHDPRAELVRLATAKCSTACGLFVAPTCGLR